MKLRVLSVAELESVEAAAWYEEQSAGPGFEFLAALDEAIRAIREDPMSFSRLEYYSGSFDVRRFVLRRFPYLIIFACMAEKSLVVAVCHTRRMPLYWLDRLS